MEELKKEDYAEPRCLLCDPATGQPQGGTGHAVPLGRILEKLDVHCGKEDYAAAERHLLYWIAEAEATGDARGRFTLLNEAMGFYRKQGQKENAVAYAAQALEAMQSLQYADTPSGATCFVNCGTVYDAFGMPEEAIGFFEKAQVIYEAAAHREWAKLGGLYNNMALAQRDLGHYAEAEAYYTKALEAMKQVEHGELEQAITWLNLADAVALRDGAAASQDEIASYVQRAKELLETPDIPRNGYYAFVLEKCAPAFFCHGDAVYGETIEARARAIYAENRDRA